MSADDKQVFSNEFGPLDDPLFELGFRDASVKRHGIVKVDGVAAVAN
ncbi:MAG: hypothetical protein ACXVY7_09355 [Gaiellaceae bacterium]